MGILITFPSLVDPPRWSIIQQVCRTLWKSSQRIVLLQNSRNLKRGVRQTKQRLPQVISSRSSSDSELPSIRSSWLRCMRRECR